MTDCLMTKKKLNTFLKHFFNCLADTSWSHAVETTCIDVFKVVSMPFDHCVLSRKSGSNVVGINVLA